MENSEKLGKIEKKSVNTAKNGKIYSANELCNIIKTCSKNGVTDLKISGIEISFMDQGTDSPLAGIARTPQKERPLKKVSSAPLEPLELTDKDLEEIEELERAQIVLDDPMGFEEQVIKDFMDGEADEETRYS